jgi:hypothetical protein
MNLGPVAVDSSFSNAFVLADQREELKQRGSAVISAWQSGNLLVVTHGANIAALSGQQLAPAETLVVEPGVIPPRVIGRIPPPNEIRGPRLDRGSALGARCECPAASTCSGTLR